MAEKWYARHARGDGYITHLVSLDAEPIEDELYMGRNIATGLSGEYAHLIAAAPELLAACNLALHKIEQTLAGQYPDGGALEAAIDSLRAAISKAKGNE